MGGDLVCLEDGHAIFAPAVETFAHSLGPLIGLSTLVAKVMACRIQARRIAVSQAQVRFQHQERTKRIRIEAEALDRHSARIYAAKSNEIDLRDRESRRNTAVAIQKIETEYEAAVLAIRVNGSLARHEMDRRFSLELARIDSALRLGLQELHNDRRRTDQEFRLAMRHSRLAQSAVKQLGHGLEVATRSLGGRPQQAELGAITVAPLSSAIRSIVTEGMTPVRAVLAAVTSDNRAGKRR